MLVILHTYRHFGVKEQTNIDNKIDDIEFKYFSQFCSAVIID